MEAFYSVREYVLGQAGIDKDVVEGAVAGMFDLGDVPDMLLVTHNRPFDESCLKPAFEEFGMEYLGCNFYICRFTQAS